MSTSRHDERRKRREAHCEVPITPTPQRPVPVRPTLPCSPAPATGFPERFIKPAVPAIQPTVQEDAPPVAIGNDAVTVDCSAGPGGPTGSAISVESDAISVNLLWSEVLGPTEGQLAYIARLNPSVVLRALLELDVEAAMNILHLGRTETAQAQALATQLKRDVNDVAREAAIAALECGWLNTTKSSNCGPNALTTQEQDKTLLPVNNPVIIPAGTIFSRESQADADNEAQATADALRACVWTAEEQRVTCTSDFGYEPPTDDPANPDATEIPNDPTPWPSGRSRVGEYRLEKYAVFSTESQTDANTRGRSVALAALQCFYINGELTVSCSADEKGVPTIPAGTGSVLSNTRGSKVIAEHGAVASDTSQNEADEVAFDLATALLECRWENKEVTVECPVLTIPDIRGGPGSTRKAYPSEKSATKTYTVSAGTFVSETSQEEADALALEHANAQLECTYCNRELPPTCVPDAIQVRLNLPDGDPQKLTTPLPIGLVDPQVWSMDATLGVAAGTYCSTDPFAADMLADTTGNLPVKILIESAGEDCRYCNEPVIGSCDGVEVTSDTKLQNKALIGRCAFEVSPGDVPEGFAPELTDGSERAKAYANAMAKELALAILNCGFVCSDQKEFFCSDIGKSGVHPSSSGSVTNPVVIPRCAFMGNSLVEANKQRDELGKSLLYCYYLNDTVQILCDDNPLASASTATSNGVQTISYGSGSQTPCDASGPKTPVDPASVGSADQPVVVPAGTIMSFDSVADANGQAAQLGYGQLFCFWRSVPVSLLCGYNQQMPWVSANAGGGQVQSGDGKLKGRETVLEPGRPGKPFVVNGGMFIDTCSRKRATEPAYAIAAAAMNCAVCNVDVLEGCVSNDPGNTGLPSSFAKLKAQVSKCVVLSQEGPTEADTLAKELARQMLFCSYTNAPINEDKCNGQFLIGPSALPMNFFHGNSTTAMTAQAREFLLSMQTCLDTDSLSGADGAQTSCSGTCSAFYS